MISVFFSSIIQNKQTSFEQSSMHVWKSIKVKDDAGNLFLSIYSIRTTSYSGKDYIFFNYFYWLIYFLSNRFKRMNNVFIIINHQLFRSSEFILRSGKMWQKKNLFFKVVREFVVRERLFHHKQHVVLVYHGAHCKLWRSFDFIKIIVLFFLEQYLFLLSLVFVLWQFV